MKEILLGVLPAFAAFAVFAGIWVVVKLEERQRMSAGERPPVKDKMLRPPGHSLANKVDDLQERMLLGFVLSVVVASFLGVFLSTTGWSQPLMLTVLTGALIVFFVNTLRPRQELRACRLGLWGEQMMAEELDKLTREGYWIFHDFPGGPDWNIDHVAVGPGGVFAIETKTRRKRKPLPGRKEHEVVFDGGKLQFGWGDEREAIPQAQRNAVSLARFLESSVGEKVWVTPVLVIPGWLVTLKTKSPFPILSGRATAGFIGAEKALLSDKLIKRVAHQLEQKCRDVEF